MKVPKPLTYQDVANACQQLVAAGEKLTQRKIQKLTGGSFSTLAPLYRQWQEQQMLIQQANQRILSDTLMQALLAEFVRIEQSVHDALNQQLNTKQQQLQEMEDVLSDYEKNIDELKVALARSEEQYNDMCEEYKSKVIMLKERSDSYELRVKVLEQQLTEKTNARHQQEIDSAVVKAKHQALMKHNQWLENELHRIRCGQTQTSLMKVI